MIWCILPILISILWWFSSWWVSIVWTCSRREAMEERPSGSSNFFVITGMMSFISIFYQINVSDRSWHLQRRAGTLNIVCLQHIPNKDTMHAKWMCVCVCVCGVASEIKKQKSSSFVSQRRRKVQTEKASEAFLLLSTLWSSVSCGDLKHVLLSSSRAEWATQSATGRNLETQIHRQGGCDQRLLIPWGFNF